MTLIETIQTIFKNMRFRLRQRLTGAAGAPTDLLSGEQFLHHSEGNVYVGTGNDGNGNSTGQELVGGRGKANTVHSHAVADVTGLSDALAAKANQNWVTDSLNTKAGLAMTQQAIADVLAAANGKLSPSATIAGLGVTDVFTKAEVIAREALINGVDADQAAALASFSAALATQGTDEQNHAAALLANIANEAQTARAAEADAKARAIAAQTTADAKLTTTQVQTLVNDAILAAFAGITSFSGGQVA
jgi:hypothetical protein